MERKRKRVADNKYNREVKYMRFKIRPTMEQCRYCMETAASFNVEPACSSCNTEEYEMITIDNDYVYYADKHELKKIHMDRVIVL